MALFDRDKLAKTAQEIADHMAIVYNIKALQAAQRELAEKFEKLNGRVAGMEAELRAAQAEVARDTLRDTQLMVNSVQGGMNQRLQDLAVNLAILRNEISRRGDDIALTGTPLSSANIGGQNRIDDTGGDAS